MDAFDVLGLAPAFALDATELEQRYRDLQRQLHPDKFVHASSSERRESLSRAVSVNDAYRVLKDPLKRAELVLARAVGKEPSEATAEPELLMEIMELREELASARKKRDLPKAHQLARDVSAREAAQLDQLGTALTALAQERTAPCIDQATRALTRLRYYRRFHDEVASLEDDLSE